MYRVFYKYMRSHWLKTLGNCRFMVSRPSKYWKEWSHSAPSDPAECLPTINGGERFPLLERLSLSPAVFREQFNKEFADPNTMDRIIRILCLSDPSKCAATDLHRWEKYGATFEGVRIGIRLPVGDDGVCASYREFRGEYVSYEATPNIIQTRGILTHTELSDKCFEVIFKKDRAKFSVESEFRLLTDCRHVKRDSGGLDFLQLENKMIFSVDVGYKMSKENIKALFKLCKRNFSLSGFRKAMPHGALVEYTEVNL